MPGRSTAGTLPAGRAPGAGVPPAANRSLTGLGGNNFGAASRRPVGSAGSAYAGSAFARGAAVGATTAAVAGGAAAAVGNAASGTANTVVNTTTNMRGDAINSQSVPRAPVGSRVNRLPWGYSTVGYGDRRYYYHDGCYYEPYWNDNSWSYTVIDPPVGITIYDLPIGCDLKVVNGEHVYDCTGAWYKRVLVNGQVGYVAIAKP